MPSYYRVVPLTGDREKRSPCADMAACKASTWELGFIWQGMSHHAMSCQVQWGKLVEQTQLINNLCKIILIIYSMCIRRVDTAVIFVCTYAIKNKFTEAQLSVSAACQSPKASRKCKIRASHCSFCRERWRCTRALFMSALLRVHAADICIYLPEVS